MSKAAVSAKPIRCAIYTRKSSEGGLEQDFNSLHAQRAACSAYILSQAGENWSELPTLYDDGAYSGGSMELPALQRLLADIQNGRVDVVVVYKVDRLTRALGDFARIVEVFDQAGASFVSVTQAFNTTTSMGRLTLNVLLSFAQFEREVTGERIRDKIAASKQKGMWMGGTPALGYDPAGRTLTINPGEAETVRMIFRRYLEIGSVYRLRDELEQAGAVSKRCVFKTGKVRGGVPLNRGALFHLLRNRLYLGEIPHKDQSYPGQHPAIVDTELFYAVQAKLDETTTRPHSSDVRRASAVSDMPLSRLIFDSAGKPMSPVKARRSGGATYRYYVSIACHVGEREKAGARPRISAPVVEELIADRLRRLGVFDEPGGDPDWVRIRAVLRRVIVGSDQLVVTLAPEVLTSKASLNASRQKLQPMDTLSDTGAGWVLTLPLVLARTSIGVVAVGPDGRQALTTPAVDKPLYAALVRAEAWKLRLLEGEAATFDTLAKDEGVTSAFVRRLVRIAYLAPDLKRAILDGRQPLALNLQAIMTRELPLAWPAQRALLSR